MSEIDDLKAQINELALQNRQLRVQIDALQRKLDSNPPLKETTLKPERHHRFRKPPKALF